MTQQYDDEITMKGREPNGEFELVPEGIYPAVLESIETMMMPAFEAKDGEMVRKGKFVFRITGGDWADLKVDKLATLDVNIANDRAGLHQLYKGITGVTPQPDTEYRIKADCIGRSCMIVVENYTNAKGQTWARVKSVSQPAPARQRKAQPVAAAVAEDDDLRDA